MGTLASFLMGIIGPMAIKALIAIGIGTLTFTGVTASLQTLIDMATQNWSALPAAVLALCSLAGFPQALGIICGAMSARVGMWAALSASNFILKK